MSAPSEDIAIDLQEHVDVEEKQIEASAAARLAKEEMIITKEAQQEQLRLIEQERPVNYKELLSIDARLRTIEQSLHITSPPKKDDPKLGDDNINLELVEMID